VPVDWDTHSTSRMFLYELLQKIMQATTDGQVGFKLCSLERCLFRHLIMFTLI
jgi:hypothetical protein